MSKSARALQTALLEADNAVVRQRLAILETQEERRLLRIALAEQREREAARKRRLGRA